MKDKAQGTFKLNHHRPFSVSIGTRVLQGIEFIRELCTPTGATPAPLVAACGYESNLLM